MKKNNENMKLQNGNELERAKCVDNILRKYFKYLIGNTVFQLNKQKFYEKKK